jgi:hypothetical protein
MKTNKTNRTKKINKIRKQICGKIRDLNLLIEEGGNDKSIVTVKGKKKKYVYECNMDIDIAKKPK